MLMALQSAPPADEHVWAAVEAEALPHVDRLFRLALDATAAEVALEDFRVLDLQRHAHEPLLARAWELPKNLTAYDAVYVIIGTASCHVIAACERTHDYDRAA